MFCKTLKIGFLYLILFLIVRNLITQAEELNNLNVNDKASEINSPNEKILVDVLLNDLENLNHPSHTAKKTFQIREENIRNKNYFSGFDTSRNTIVGTGKSGSSATKYAVDHDLKITSTIPLKIKSYSQTVVNYREGPTTLINLVAVDKHGNKETDFIIDPKLITVTEFEDEAAKKKLIRKTRDVAQEISISSSSEQFTIDNINPTLNPEIVILNIDNKNISIINGNNTESIDIEDIGNFSIDESQSVESLNDLSPSEVQIPTILFPNTPEMNTSESTLNFQEVPTISSDLELATSISTIPITEENNEDANSDFETINTNFDTEIPSTESTSLLVDTFTEIIPEETEETEETESDNNLTTDPNEIITDSIENTTESNNNSDELIFFTNITVGNPNTTNSLSVYVGFKIDENNFLPNLGTYTSDTYKYIYEKTSLLNPFVTKKECPFISNKPFSQRLITPVKTIGVAAAWDSRENNVLIVDQFGQQISAFNPDNGKVATVTVASVTLHAILPTKNSTEYIVVVDNKIATIETSFKKNALIIKLKKIYVTFDPVWSFSVARTDFQGRVWIAAKFKKEGDNHTIYNDIYMINNGRAVIKEQNLRSVSGMAWAKDSSHYFITDHENRLIYKYKFDKKTGNLSNKKILLNFADYPDIFGVPFDLVVDNKKDLWVTLFDGSAIVNVDHETGKVKRLIAIPSRFIYSLTFGGKKQERLFITTGFSTEPSINIPYTIVVSNLEVTGISATQNVDTEKVFGSKTINVQIPEAADFKSPFINAHNTSELSTNFKCNYENHQNNKFKRLFLWTCGFRKDKYTVQQVSLPINTIGLSLHYDQKDKAIYFTDMFEPSVLKYSPNTGKNVKLSLNGVSTVTTIIPMKGRKNEFIVAQDHKLVLFENKFENSQNDVEPYKKIIAEVEEMDFDEVFNIGKVDSKGRLFIGTKHLITNQKNNKLYLLKKRVLKVVEKNINRSGGMTWSTNNKLFYFADAGEGIIYKYKFGENSGKISQKKILFSMKNQTDLNIKGTINDITTDNENYIWAALYGGGAVLRISTISGKISQIIPISTTYPTSLEFGGKNRDTLFVTSAHKGDCNIENMGYTFAISNLGVQAGKMKTNEFIL